MPPHLTQDGPRLLLSDSLDSGFLGKDQIAAACRGEEKGEVRKGGHHFVLFLICRFHSFTL